MDRPVEITRSYAECKFCNDIADMCNEIPDCTHCENRKGTWIDTITSLLGTKAVVVLEDGKVETYPLDRLKVITKRGEIMKIIEEIGEAAMLEQLAEECTELAKAALKMARIIRKENPTPVTEKEAIDNIREEYTDVVQCAGELSLTVDEEQMARKHERWEKRVRDRE